MVSELYIRSLVQILVILIFVSCEEFNIRIGEYASHAHQWELLLVHIRIIVQSGFSYIIFKREILHTFTLILPDVAVKITIEYWIDYCMILDSMCDFYYHTRSVLESVEVGVIMCVAFLFTKFKYELHNLIFI